MATWKVAHSYRSDQAAFEKGDTVEVDDDLAEWINRDSPGCLVEHKPRAEKRAGGKARVGS